MRRKTLILVISTALIGAAAQAQPSDTPYQAQPATDASRSSAATASEASAKAKAKWTEADKDRNGSLSLAEMQASMPTAARNFAQMDANGDGQVSRAEMHDFKAVSEDRKWRQSFAAADTDSNGALSLAEALGGMPEVAGQFASIDANRDSKVTFDELRAHQKTLRDETRDASQTLRHSTDTTMEVDPSSRTSDPTAARQSSPRSEPDGSLQH